MALLNSNTAFIFETTTLAYYAVETLAERDLENDVLKEALSKNW